MVKNDRDAIRRLLLTFPDEGPETKGKDVVDTVVEGAICEILNEQDNNRYIVTPEEVRSKLDNLTHLEYSESEIRASFRRLAEADRVDVVNEQAAAIQLKEDRYFEVTETAERTRSRLREVAEGWKTEVIARHGVTESEAVSLWKALDSFIADLVYDYGAEAAAHLYGDEEGGELRLYNELTSELPSLSHYVEDGLVDVARQEFSSFVQGAEGGRAEYLDRRLRTAFFYHLLSIDPSASRLAREYVKNKTLYIDTNFIYRLLSLHGVRRARGPIEVAELADELECKLVVTEQTLREFVSSVRYNAEDIRNEPVRSKAYQSVIAEYPSAEGTVTGAFYRELIDGQISSLDEFVRKYENVEHLLEKWNIEVIEEAVLTDDIKSDPQFERLKSGFDDWLRHRDSGRKSDKVEHDAFMLWWIRSERGDEARRVVDLDTWFLTYDKKLNAFAAHNATEAEGQRTETLLASEWLQLSRPFLPRTEEHERSFLALIGHPVLYHNESDVVETGQLRRALNRLERYADLPEEVAGAMVASTEFTKRIAQVETEEEFEREVEERFGHVAHELERRRENVERRLQEKEDERRRLEENLEELRQAHQEEIERLNEEREGLEEANEELERRLSESESSVDSLSAKLDNQSDELEELKDWLLYAAVVGVTVLAATLLLGANWNDLPESFRAVAVGGTICVATAMLGKPLDAKVAASTTVLTVLSTIGWVLVV